MKVSVVVPIYNAEKDIERCAKSLFAQTCKETEFIFVDDASTDSVIERLQHIINQNPEIKNRTSIIRRCKNGGVAAARLDGMKAATGDYIIHADSDDYVAPEMIEHMLSAAEKQDADVVVCDFWYDSGKKLEHKHVSAPIDPELCLSMQLSGEIYNSLWNKLVKRDIIVNNDIYPLQGLNMYEDKHIMIRVMYYAKKVAYVPKPLYYYNIANPDSISSQSQARQLDSLLKLMNLTDDFFADKHYSELISHALDNMKMAVLGSILVHGTKEQYRTNESTFHTFETHDILHQPVIPFYYKIALLAHKYQMPFVHYAIHGLVSTMGALFK